jgi:hypothetical protein
MMNFFGNSSSSDDEDEALDGDEVESENMMLTIERYNDHHFESLIEHAPPPMSSSKQCDACILSPRAP